MLEQFEKEKNYDNGVEDGVDAVLAVAEDILGAIICKVKKSIKTEVIKSLKDDPR